MYLPGENIEVSGGIAELDDAVIRDVTSCSSSHSSEEAGSAAVEVEMRDITEPGPSESAAIHVRTTAPFSNPLQGKRVGGQVSIGLVVRDVDKSNS